MGRPFCRHVQEINYVEVYRGDKVGVVMVVLGILYFIFSFIIIYFIKVQERYARDGDNNAMKSVIFPVFVNILWVNAGVNVYAGMIAWAYNFQPTDNDNKSGALAFAIMWAIQHMVNEGVAFLLMQKGLGVNAAKKSLQWSILWGLFTFIMQIGAFSAEKRQTTFVIDLFWNLVLLLFYFVLWFAPTKRLYRRPAAIFYARFWGSFRLIPIISSILYLFNSTYAEGNCLYVFGALFAYVLLQPIVLYYTFILDSRWWQGFEIFEAKRDTNDIRSPLQGMDLDMHSARSLAASMDDLGIRNLRQGKTAVHLLNFAYISLDSQKLLGCGSFSKVYIGKYRRRECAIKLIFTLDLTQSVIRRIASEALILSKIRHPNVVDILGVSVLPPSVCILLELCEYGSLFDVIGGTGPSHIHCDSETYISDFIKGERKIKKYSKRSIAISWADRLHLAIGCAKGLSALHTYSAGMCHRDVKSFNFLVDSQLHAKISDLELGISDAENEDLKRRKALLGSKKSQKKKTANSTVILSGSSQQSADINCLSNQSQLSNVDLEQSAGKDEEPFEADEFLANWAAPEVIRDGIHCQASDIYSLGLVLWELLSGLVPFHEVKRQDDIRQRVMNGIRPIIPACFVEGLRGSVFKEYIDLITKCWHAELTERPTALQVVTYLEAIYNRQCSDILQSTNAMVDYEPIGTQASMLSSLLGSPKQIKESFSKERIGEIWMRLKSESLRDTGNCLDRFESTGQAWVLLANDPALTIIWASTVWEEEVVTDLNKIVGTSIKDFSWCSAEQAVTPMLQSLCTAPKLFEKISSVSDGQSKHLIAPLLLTNWASFSSLRSDNAHIAPGHSIFALHVFPIMSRSKVKSRDIPIANNDNEDSRIRRLSSSVKRSFSFGVSTGSTGGGKFALSPLYGTQSPVELLPHPSLHNRVEEALDLEEGQTPFRSSLIEKERVTGDEEKEHLDLEDSSKTEGMWNKSYPQKMSIVSSDVAMIAVLFHRIK